MADAGLEEVRFRFDFEGTKVVLSLTMLPVAILAGGLATRLRPLTESRAEIPARRLPGARSYFISSDMLRDQGVDRVVLCVAHLGEQIQAAVNVGAAPGLAVSYSFDGDELLGTGGALKQALPLLGEDFFVLNGDSYLPCSLRRIQSAYRAARRPALMTVLRNDNRWDQSNVLFRNGELLAYDKRAPRPDMSPYRLWPVGSVPQPSSRTTGKPGS